MSYHALLQGIFLTQGLDSCLLQLLHWRQTLYCSATGKSFSPFILLQSCFYSNHLKLPLVTSSIPSHLKRQWLTFSSDSAHHMKRLITLSSLKCLSVGLQQLPPSPPPFPRVSFSFSDCTSLTVLGSFVGPSPAHSSPLGKVVLRASLVPLSSFHPTAYLSA